MRDSIKLLRLGCICAADKETDNIFVGKFSSKKPRFSGFSEEENCNKKILSYLLLIDYMKAYFSGEK